MFATGLVLYMPALAQLFSSRPIVKGIHLVAAVAWLTALALVALLGDRRALRRTRRELERFDADDLRWLRRRPAPQGRFNAGQKAHAIVQAALALLFTVSGALLWLGERNTDLRLPGTIALHDASMVVAGALVAGPCLDRFEPRQAAVAGGHPARHGPGGLGGRAPPEVGGGAGGGAPRARAATGPCETGAGAPGRRGDRGPRGRGRSGRPRRIPVARK